MDKNVHRKMERKIKREKERERKREKNVVEITVFCLGSELVFFLGI